MSAFAKLCECGHVLSGHRTDGRCYYTFCYCSSRPAAVPVGEAEPPGAPSEPEGVTGTPEKVSPASGSLGVGVGEGGQTGGAPSGRADAGPDPWLPTKLELREVISEHVRLTEPFSTCEQIAAVVHDYLERRR